MESMMTLQVRKKIHDVRYYNDDNGHGLTACGVRVYPWSVTKAGPVTCKKCVKGEKK
jgi:hypothetical protein